MSHRHYGCIVNEHVNSAQVDSNPGKGFDDVRFFREVNFEGVNLPVLVFVLDFLKKKKYSEVGS